MTKALRIDKSIDARVIADCCSELDLTNVIIANDDIADDEILSTIMKMSLPHNLRVAIKDVDVAGELLKDKLCEHISILVIVKNLRDALYIINSAGCITQVNLVDFDQLYADIKKGNKNSSTEDERIMEFEILHEIVRLVPDSTYQTNTTDKTVLIKELLSNHTT